MESKKTPIFIFSLPRSGSTLLQRILIQSKEICSVVEPWILLPMVYSYKDRPTFLDPSIESKSNFVKYFIENNLPNKYKDYRKEINKMVTSLYEKACRNSDGKYFLDKTPRYYLIIPEIAKIFPDAKFIFLFRNPVSIASSIIDRWLNNKLRFGNYRMDIKRGPKFLVEGHEKIKDKSISVKYEDLISNPGEEIKKIFDYLDLKVDIGKIMNSVETSYIPGDVNKSQYYGKPILDYSKKWKKVINTPVRKRFMKSYLRGLGDPVLKKMGYNIDKIIKEIRENKNKKINILTDIFDIIIDNLKFYTPEEIKTKFKNIK